MKRMTLLGLLAAAILTVPAGASRAIPVQVDGQVLDGPCYVDHGTTYVPLRTLLDTLGGWEIWWDSQLRSAVAVSGERRLVADPAADTIELDGDVRSGRVTVQSGRTYVPLRTAAELLGGDVCWDPYLDGAVMTSADADYDAGELYWLSRIISAESRGEPIEGQIAVGNVVLERVESADFPDTIPDVIFDCKDCIQFEPVENGTVYQEPAESSVEAAKRALDGEETLHGALFFYAPALSQGTWIRENRTYLATIGCHRFYM